ncbi:MAG: hypothetical protein KBT01_02100, partial [Clostridiales bacterium]|nr:hypothetical protein [Candidatus Blautia equi]
MRSRVFSSKLLKNHISGAMWAPVLLLVAYFFAFPVYQLLSIGNWEIRQFSASQFQAVFDLFYRNNLLQSGAWIIALAAFLNAMLGFFYLYSREKIDFYHALPVKRSHMFLQKTFMGVCYTFIPYVIMMFFSFCITAFRGYFHFETIKIAVLVLLTHLLTYLFLYFCMVLILTVTGTVLMGVLSTVGFAAVFPLFYLVLSGYQREFLNTTTIYGYENLFIFRDLSPVYLVAQLCGGGLPYSRYYLYGFFFTLFFGVISYLAYVRRPSEATGKAIVFPWFGLVVKILVTVLGGLTLGMVLMDMQPYSRMVWGIFGLAAGVILTKGMMEVLYAMDFRGFLKHRVQLLAALILTFGIAAVFALDLTHFDTYLPAYEKLESVSLLLPGYGPGTDLLIQQEDGGYFNYDLCRECGLYKDETGVGEKVYAVLQNIIKANEADEITVSPEESRCLTVRYNLRSGGSALRSYQVDRELMQQLLLALNEETNLREHSLAPLSNPELNQYLYVEGIFFNQDAFDLFTGEPEKLNAFVEAFYADYMEATPEELVFMEPAAQLQIHYERIPTSNINVSAGYLSAYGPVENHTSVWKEFGVPATFKRTMKILEEFKEPLGTEDLDVKKASVILESVFTTKEAIEEITNYIQSDPYPITDP